MSATRSRATSRSVSTSMETVPGRSEEHTSELQSRRDLVCRLLLEKKKNSGGSGEGIEQSRRDGGIRAAGGGILFACCRHHLAPSGCVRYGRCAGGAQR